MRAFVITLSDNPESFEQADVLIDSSNHFQNDFDVEKFIATTPENVVEAFLAEKIQWNYPWTQEVIDLQTGLRKTPYETADPKKSAWRALCPIIGCGRSVQKITRLSLS